MFDLRLTPVFDRLPVQINNAVSYNKQKSSLQSISTKPTPFKKLKVRSVNEIEIVNAARMTHITSSCVSGSKSFSYSLEACLQELHLQTTVPVQMVAMTMMPSSVCFMKMKDIHRKNMENGYADMPICLP